MVWARSSSRRRAPTRTCPAAWDEVAWPHDGLVTAWDEGESPPSWDSPAPHHTRPASIRRPPVRLLALGLLMLAPLAGATLAALVVPHQATAQGETMTEARPSAWTDAQHDPDGPRAAASAPVDRLRQHAQAEVLRLTRLLRDVRAEQADARPASHPTWEAALSALIAGRAGHATVSAALRRAGSQARPEHLAALARDTRAAADDVRRGHALLAAARRQTGWPSAGRDSPAGTAPVLTGPVNPLDPAVPATARAIASPSRPVRQAPDTVAMAAEPAGPSPAATSSALDGAGLVGPLMDRPSVMMTGPLALPPAGVDPFRRGGPADWEPALTPLARPPADPSVFVNPAFAGPMPAYESLLPVMDPAAQVAAVPRPHARATTATAPNTPHPSATPITPTVVRQPPAATPLPAPLGSSTLRAIPAPQTRAPTPPPATRPVAPTREIPVSRVEPPGAPPPAAAVTDPAPLGERGHASRPIPFEVRPDATTAGPDAPPERQFASIAAQVAVEREKAAQILQRVGPVRTDLTRRIDALSAADDRRAALGQVMETVNAAEGSLRTAIEQYDALNRQLDWALSIVESGRASGSQWSPRDASRQAIAASVQARQGVTGLKLAMGQFERVMGLGPGGERIGE